MSRKALTQSRVWLALIVGSVTYLVLVRLALSVFGWERMYTWLGQDVYNQLVAGGGVAQVLLVLGVLLVADAVLILGTAVVRATSRATAARLGRPASVTAGLAVLVALIAGGSFTWSSYAPGSPLEVLLSACAGHDTEYAPGYDEQAFRRITAGMSRDEVMQALGPPLASWSHDAGTVAAYSRSPGDTHYWQRTVCYDGTGQVEQRIRQFYVD